MRDTEEDGSRGPILLLCWILRLYESRGGRGPVTVTCELPFKSVTECNLVEEDERKLRLKRGQFAYEIKTFRLLVK